MTERWDDLAAEDLVSGYLADLSDSNPNGLPLDPERAEAVNMDIREALAERDTRRLERALLNAQDAWTTEPGSGYAPPEDWWNDE